ncbi:hypothetical protein HDU97_004284 [Phlyctochytrium planicorne]|nr:hypothetical protein HDU97_004284 [Phlyctochytrium planicorne]
MSIPSPEAECGRYQSGNLSGPGGSSNANDSQDNCARACGSLGFKYGGFALENGSDPYCVCVKARTSSPGYCVPCDVNRPQLGRCGENKTFSAPNSVDVFTFPSKADSSPPPVTPQQPPVPSSSSPPSSPQNPPSNPSPTQTNNPSPESPNPPTSPSTGSPGSPASPGSPGGITSAAPGSPDASSAPSGSQGAISPTNSPTNALNAVSDGNGGTMVVVTSTFEGRVVVKTSFVPGAKETDASANSINGLSIPLVVGIVGGVVVIATIIVSAVIISMRRKGRKQKEKDTLQPPQDREYDMQHLHQPPHQPEPQSPQSGFEFTIVSSVTIGPEKVTTGEDMSRAMIVLDNEHPRDIKKDERVEGNLFQNMQPGQMEKREDEWDDVKKTRAYEESFNRSTSVAKPSDFGSSHHRNRQEEAMSSHHHHIQEGNVLRLTLTEPGEGMRPSSRQSFSQLPPYSYNQE